MTQPSGQILYLHGFRSSPQSWKVRLLAEATLAAYPGYMWVA